ncbi:cohesin subunit SA-1 [Entelurus aequoreus]|uniref:cohesin subunit SA-1 n=1 Tax=Entelurus aequoreus TaxID=161455 RepID=UPI002B1E80F6|nr:cohesin subunit SA-1 [Entelurus aequoreus]XP_061895569.1 cohesin subunit SA-1 [Entelurus aequoreus]XP_061895570.1 cohesin subunit SA-1 [Entelurus aequoreus]XP_061895571.1 cohesin subunit SA-1 [Entelurus aequoreus]
MSSHDLDSFEDLTDLDEDYVVPAKTTKRKKQALEQSLLPRRQRRKAALSATPDSPGSSISSPPDASQQQQSSQGPRHSSPKPRARPGNRGPRGISADDIYKAVSSGKAAIVVVVDEWMDSYKQSRETGLLVLINFIVQSCGCKGEVSRDMLDSMPNADIIATLTGQFDMDSATYPLSTTGLLLKKIKAGLFEFTRILVRSCGSRVIYDEYLFPSVLSLLTGLTDSQVRAFRHTSTLLAIKIMSGMLEIAVTVSFQLHPIQRHYDKENSKQTDERDSERLEDLRAGIRELQEKKEELLSMINTAFRGIFVHRYRDKLMEIRAACMEELGVWIKTDPENFLNDGYIKYLGWMIHDKQSLVRLKCVRSLQALYQEEEFIGRLELFTSRFKERLVNMVMDVDPEVAVETVKLLLLIHRGMEEGLSEKECAHIYPLVYTSSRTLASAGGLFLYKKLKSLIDSEKQSGNIMDFFQILISFHIQSEFHNHGTYLVDSLWDVAGSELKDWETMTTLLQQEAGLMDEEEGALIELMMCVIQQAAEAKPPVGRVSAKKALNMKEKKTQEQDRRRITNHFIPLLPQLLTKYSADAGKVKLLLQAPLYFNLAMYSSVNRMNKHLDQLLSQICEIVEKHTDTAVLEACGRLFSVLCSDRYAFSSRARLAFSQLVDSLTECFSTYFNDLLQDTADVYSAATALKRIAVLSSARDLTAWRLFDSCIHLLESRMDSRDLDELIVSALRCSALHLMWTNKNVQHSAPTEEELRCLSKEVGSFCDICQGCLCVDQAEIRDEAFQLLCDLLCFYSSNHVRTDSTLQSLYYLPNDFLRTELANFLMDYIFSDSYIVATEDEHEEEIALLQKKRLQLAGYCRLVLVGVLDYEAATDVFKHYHMYFRDFGDIIKGTIIKLRDVGQEMCAKILCLSMQQLFSVMLMEEDVSRQDISKIRDLARMFAQSFGADLTRARRPLLALHMDGIEFAFRVQQEGEEESHPNVAFLDILSEFSLKLPEQEQTQLSTFLKARCPDAALSWPAVKMYRCFLEGRASARPRLESAGSVGAVPPQSAQAAKRRKTTAQESSSSTVESSWLESSKLPSNLSTPVITSTVQKHPATQPGPREDVILESDVGSNLTESEDEFSSGSQMRKVNLSRRLHSSFGQQSSTLDPKELNTHLTLLSLIEDDAAEQEVDEYESDSSYTLPSTRHSTSVMDELFDSSPVHI